MSFGFLLIASAEEPIRAHKNKITSAVPIRKLNDMLAYQTGKSRIESMELEYKWLM